MRTPRTSAVTALAALTLVVAACGGDDGDSAEAGAESATATEVPADDVTADEVATGEAAAGVTLVSPDEAAATIADPPDDLVVLDVRTPEEFDEGHVDGAVMLDFYEPGFAEDLASLDRDVPYVVYCRSGNRSGQTVAMMEQLGFSSVQDVDGGIVAWQDAGLPLTTD